MHEQAFRAAEQERYYSFDYGDAHFFSLESNDVPLIQPSLRGGRETDDMLDWLADDLARSDAEWKIAFFHHPPFTSSTRGPNERVRELLLPILEEGGVDLVLVGHDHHYERMIPLRGTCAAAGPDAITYVIAGGGGASLRDVRSWDSWFTAAIEDQVHSYLRLTIHGCIAHGEAYDVDGRRFDEFDVDGCD